MNVQRMLNVIDISALEAIDFRSSTHLKNKFGSQRFWWLEFLVKLKIENRKSVMHSAPMLYSSFVSL
jgi:hypothetical protein